MGRPKKPKTTPPKHRRAPRGISALMAALAAPVLLEGLRRREAAASAVRGIDDNKVPPSVRGGGEAR